MGAGRVPVTVGLKDRFFATRKLTVDLTTPLSDADATVQSMPDTSPAKWHLAHVTWFLESFVLRDHVPQYRAFDDNFAYLFNSYYEAEGARHTRAARGLITRPSLGQILDYRTHVESAIEAHWNNLPETALQLVELGIQHEQQHQELLLTDILHLFAQNPIYPAYWPTPIIGDAAIFREDGAGWREGPWGLQSIGFEGAGFAFDCEGPRHEVYLQPFALCERTVSNAEWMYFMNDGGYSDPHLWLSDGWSWVQREGIAAPLYWQQNSDGQWLSFGLDGLRAVDLSAPVTHISLYEADAYASWANARLPTEAEWEVAAASFPSGEGHLLDRPGPVRPKVAGCSNPFGNVWQWTGSAYRPYPGFRAAAGAVGEYNGKFMSGQFVLRGGSCATPRGHVRASYRNFFYPHQRWQFTGLRLAKNV
ncbi:ergothioneine biosynthesis protein EgtB [Sphingorhabdus sp. IMCC26285]|uniref:Ergothioneine biosynthesis protein EgtB n=1 Tax=Sphingorhabdus profundilacus TaxID=2509718 RepID=A0A6I4LW27_9SPHN|nr:ergothioneine biosynthesis protein EgtB [Sphingorhabdus profundilacus]